MRYIKSLAIRYCPSLSSKVCCTVNTRYYYYNCAVFNSFALGVQGFPRTSRQNWHSTTILQGLTSESFLWTVWVITGWIAEPWVTVTRWLSPTHYQAPPEMKAACLNADSLYHTVPISGFMETHFTRHTFSSEITVMSVISALHNLVLFFYLCFI